MHRYVWYTDWIEHEIRVRGDSIVAHRASNGTAMPKLSLMCAISLARTVVASFAACRASPDLAPPPLWAMLSASEAYTCGLSPGGEALCWGGVAGYYDPVPLADSLIPNSAIPLRVPGTRHFTQITVGGLSMCALDSDQRAFCWGANQYGEVGDSSHLAKR